MRHRPPPVVRDAFRYAQRQLDCELEGECLNASVLMHKFLSYRGIPVELRRYESVEHGGHWTIVTPYGEYDPTIGYWPEASEWGYEEGLVVVDDESPHKNWSVDADVDEATAYETAAIEP